MVDRGYYRGYGVAPKRTEGRHQFPPDPRHGDLPGLSLTQGDGGKTRARLQVAMADYAEVAERIQSAVSSLEEQFGPAFAAEDARRATQDRINRAANPDAIRKAEERRRRIG